MRPVEESDYLGDGLIIYIYINTYFPSPSFISVTSNRNVCGRKLFMCGAYSKRAVCLN